MRDCKDFVSEFEEGNFVFSFRILEGKAPVGTVRLLAYGPDNGASEVHKGIFHLCGEDELCNLLHCIAFDEAPEIEFSVLVYVENLFCLDQIGFAQVQSVLQLLRWLYFRFGAIENGDLTCRIVRIENLVYSRQFLADVAPKAAGLAFVGQNQLELEF